MNNVKNPESDNSFKEKKSFDMLSLGEILLRLSPPTSERLVRGDLLRKQTGGAELNVACGIAMLGLRTGIISKIPDNDIGYFVKNYIRFCGVSDDYLVYDKTKDARLGIYFYEDGASPRKPTVIYDRKKSAMYSMSIEDVPDKIYGETRCFHTSGITLALDDGIRNTAVEMIRKFKQGGALISFDVNFRANLWDEKQAKKCVEEILPYVDVFFCSETTARLTFGKSGTLRDIMKEFTSEYPISVVASTQRTVHSPKNHTFTSVIYSAKNNEFYEEEPYRNIDVVDRIGSGDAYVSGVLYGLLAYDGDCRRALEYGNAYSSVKNTIPGDLPSCNLRDTDRVIMQHKGENNSEMNR
ncbi:MAG: sugar kinase [Eubacteriales bacterium]|nr:sugar kinase [Eubacteriales bacterium]